MKTSKQSIKFGTQLRNQSEMHLGDLVGIEYSDTYEAYIVHHQNSMKRYATLNGAVKEMARCGYSPTGDRLGS